MATDTDTTAVFTRARNAISSAQRVSAEISSVINQCRDLTIGADHVPQERPAVCEGSTSTQAQSPHDGAYSKLAMCQVKLSCLKAQHESTLSNLIKLRLKQLLLRQSQLSALRALLQSQLSALQPPAPLQNTRASIQSALSLISDSLVSLDNTFQLINSPVSVATILELVEVADKRADDVSGLARRLLNILQNHSEAESESTAQGVDAESLNKLLPTIECSEERAEELAREGLTCPICLAAFARGESLTSLPCNHIHHFQCLFEWLRLRSCCPMCKEQVPSA